MPENPQACLWDEWHPAKQGFLGGGQPLIIDCCQQSLTAGY